MVSLKVKKLSDVKLPKKAHPNDAGIDLHSAVDTCIPANSHSKIPTGIAIELTPGTAGFIQPRSGLAAKSGITVLNSPGLIDSGYRGEIEVILMNHSPDPFFIKKNDRIAQLVVQNVWLVTPTEVDELSDSDRGSTGFGDSGV